jgi:hypothetical protein
MDRESKKRATTSISLSSGLSEQDIVRAMETNTGMELATHPSGA